jgi:hypothetical protein
MYPKTTTFTDIDTKTRIQTITESHSVPQNNPPEQEVKHKRLEVFVQETRASETVVKTITSTRVTEGRGVGNDSL